jgi:hypothetical protein
MIAFRGVPVSSVRAALTLVLATSSLPREILISGEEKPAVVREIIEVDVALEKINPPNLVITAIGEVPTAGYSDVRLHLIRPKQPPADGILNLRLTAVPPNGGVAQVASRVQATQTITNFENAFPWLRGLRIHGAGKGTQVKMLAGGRTPPPGNAR